MEDVRTTREFLPFWGWALNLAVYNEPKVANHALIKRTNAVVVQSLKLKLHARSVLLSLVSGGGETAKEIAQLTLDSYLKNCPPMGREVFHQEYGLFYQELSENLGAVCLD